MFNEIKIGSKITTLLLAVVLLSVFAISFLSSRLSKDSIEKRYWESLSVISNLKASQLESIFKQLKDNIHFIQKSERITQSIIDAKVANFASSDVAGVVESRLNEYLIPIQEIYDYKNIVLLDIEGRIIYKSNKLSKNQVIGQAYPDYELLRDKANNGIHFGELVKTPNGVHMNVAAPILDAGQVPIGHVITEFNMDRIYQITSDTTGLGHTGEILIGKLSSSKVDFLNPQRNSAAPVLTQSVLMGDKTSEALQKAAKGQEGYDFSIDQRDKVTLANWKYLPTVGWGLVVKIDKDEINKDLDRLIIAFILSGVFIIIISFAVSVLFSKFLISPLLSLKNTLNAIARGVLPDRVRKETNDEIGEMSVAVSNLVEALKRTANFAHRIGEGEYDADFKPMSNDDTLGNALITMRDSIQRAEKRDNERNWIVSGVAEISQILRLHNGLEALGNSVISFITEKIGAVQGAFYVVNEDEEVEPVIEMKASYAYAKKKYLKGRFRFAEGLVGQAAIEQDTILRTEIPENYMTITSGLLGDRKPTCVLIVPLITNETVYGVVELASFQKFTQTQVSFVEEISVIIARTIFNIKVNERTVMLLQESQQMGEELQSQQEVLRQNAEEMEATQEELRRTNFRLEEQIQEVNRTQKRMQVLLENASEVITIYERDGKVRYISPSVESILGYTQEEMMGLHDVVHVHPESVDVVQKMFVDLLENPDEKVTIQIEYTQKNGETIWLEATGTNLLSDAAIGGIVVNSRDITERRRAEKEARMRGQMQSLSENSLDLITRMNDEGKVFYINPTIRNFTGLMPENILGKTIHEVGLHSQIVDRWSTIINDVSDRGEKLSTEMPFPAINGERIMQVNAIPEYNEKHEVESILIVSHDITERKQAEMEMMLIHKKITESINYAKRIQEAILPDTRVIQETFPNSFIYYNPRDVVSGDFPWFMHRGDDVFIAAADCTGHGVPGALISLIGYFILNDIVNTQQVVDPGTVLDLLNEGVTKTLRQDTNQSTRDGMDIALCRINRVTGQIQYAGAHRPLYYVSNGILEQVEGDRVPIGGGQLKTRGNFKTTTLTIHEGDEIYIFSDGLPDQFGGPEGKKFSPRKIRDMIIQNQGLHMSQMQQVIGKTFEQWKGEKKQTDDVLMIGIKF